jgi:HSP20 family protein
MSLTEDRERSSGVRNDEPAAWRQTQGYDWYVVRQRRVWRPPTDVYETDDNIVVKVELAGMDVSDFDISFANRRLTIAGARPDPEGKRIYQNMEIRYGPFRTEVLVGWALDQSAITATYEGGFLYVMLPKETQEHRVRVQIQGSQQED